MLVCSPYFHPKSIIPHKENGGEAAGRAKRGYYLYTANKVYISLYTVAKPPAERSETNKVYIYLYTAAMPPAERSEANKKYISTYTRRRSRRPSEARLIYRGVLKIYQFFRKFQIFKFTAGR